MEPKRNLILDTKRSNAISIAMKKLPTPQTIKVAIMKMDATVIGREGIEKLLTMLPTQEEKLKIQEAQVRKTYLYKYFFKVHSVYRIRRHIKSIVKILRSPLSGQFAAVEFNAALCLYLQRKLNH